MVNMEVKDVPEKHEIALLVFMDSAAAFLVAGTIYSDLRVIAWYRKKMRERKNRR